MFVAYQIECICALYVLLNITVPHFTDEHTNAYESDNMVLGGNATALRFRRRRYFQS